MTKKGTIRVDKEIDVQDCFNYIYRKAVKDGDYGLKVVTDDLALLMNKLMLETGMMSKFDDPIKCPKEYRHSIETLK
ncbi:MAG: hypothetical protein PWR12_353 [Eubacteriaceae bacterium]|jgi:hypothetical protein|nr:hypothetical protein [Eubacteriaceae bacterium]MDK2904277.1 hypothetical protein [Eubacteriaceae bacterium]MDK2936476.1 hypothetical protein [Eubacteriaceae bacterium]MDK2962227.1 hypothetical protein [Eubacteriaceae bacterium]